MTIRLSSEERRAQIVEAAIKIIGERGLRAFTVAHMAEEVGITDGTIFRHFKSKDEIVMGVIDRLEEIFSETIPAPSTDPLGDLGLFFLNRVKLVTSRPGIQALVFSDQLSHAGGAVALKRVTELRSRGRRHIQARLDEASQKQLIREDLDLDDILVLFHGAMMSLLSLARDDFLLGSIEARAERIWKTFLSMIRR
ncbi:MAG: TetR/AcrR family transcriptional regulator [Deltaproteobacteria bacterium]|nr:TetR/AcrR family transcriptional regulator [Deltaproteobacteria bacterium]